MQISIFIVLLAIPLISNDLIKQQYDKDDPENRGIPFSKLSEPSREVPEVSGVDQQESTDGSLDRFHSIDPASGTVEPIPVVSEDSDTGQLESADSSAYRFESTLETPKPVPTVSGAFIADQHESNNSSSDRLHRAADSHHAQKRSITDIIDRHMKLARVFNALYLRQQLSNGRIGYLDIVASLWELKDKSALQELITFESKKLTDHLASLDNVAEKVSDQEIVNVKRTKDLLKSVKEIDIVMREKLINAQHYTHSEAARNLSLNDFTVSFNFQNNYAKEAFENWKGLNESANNTIYKKHLAEFNANIGKIPPNFLGSKTLFDVEPELRYTLEVLEIIRFVNGKKNDLRTLSNHLKAAQTRMEDLQFLNDSAFNSIKTIERLDELKSLLQLIHKPSFTIPITSAFTSNQDLTNVNFNDEWILKILRNSSGLDYHMGFLKELSNHNINNSELWNLNLFSSIQKASDSSEFIRKHREYWRSPISLPNNECFEVPDDKKNWELNVLEKKLEIFLGTIKTMRDLVGYNVTEELANQTLKIEKKFPKSLDEFNTWKDSDESLEILDFIEDFNNTYNILSQSHQIKGLFDKIYKTNNRTKEIMKLSQKFRIQNETCGDLFYFSIDKWIVINDLPKTINFMKTNKSIEMITKPLLNITIPEVSEGLKRIKMIAKPETSGAFQADYPQNLLDVAYGIRSMKNIDEYDGYFEVADRRDSIIKGIADVKDPVEKAKLEMIWKHYNNIVNKLQNIKLTYRNAIERIADFTEESNLREISFVYSNLSSMAKSEKLELKKFIESFSLFDEPNLKIWNALKKLEDPVMFDLSKERDSWKRMPVALKELRHDFKCFFDPKSCEKVEVKKPRKEKVKPEIKPVNTGFFSFHSNIMLGCCFLPFLVPLGMMICNCYKKFQEKNNDGSKKNN